MDLPGTVVIPDGHFLSWQPGRDAYQSPAGLPWPLEPGRDAAQHLRTALEISPTNDMPHYYLGVMQRGQNQWATAREEFATALRLNPDNYKAHANLAQIAQAEGRLDEAERHARAALKFFPGDALSRQTLEAVLRARSLTPARP